MFVCPNFGHSNQNHLQEAVEAKKTAPECNTYLGILGQ